MGDLINIVLLVKTTIMAYLNILTKGITTYTVSYWMSVIFHFE